MRVLIACEFSGIVRDAFRRRGHDAVSCDLLPTERPGPHYKEDVLDILNEGWDMIIAFPPCTYLANSGVRWLYTQKDRWDRMVQAAEFFKRFLYADSPRIAVENPVMHRYARRIIKHKYSQIIQPWMFGEDASKATCLWLKGLPELRPTKIIKKSRYANQTKSGQNRLTPLPDRWKNRSRTYKGIAEAMSMQWNF